MRILGSSNVCRGVGVEEGRSRTFAGLLCVYFKFSLSLSPRRHTHWESMTPLHRVERVLSVGGEGAACCEHSVADPVARIS